MVEIVSPPAAEARYQTYRPVLLTADPPEGSVQPLGVVEVTAPSASQTRNLPAVGVNVDPATTDPDDGETVCVAVALRGAAMATWFSQRDMEGYPLTTVISISGTPEAVESGAMTGHRAEVAKIGTRPVLSHPHMSV